MPTVHGDITQLQEDIGGVFRQLKEMGVLTDSNVAAANTVAGLKTAISTAFSSALIHGDMKSRSADFLKAVDVASETGAISDALINPLTTVDALIALTGSTNTSNRQFFLN